MAWEASDMNGHTKVIARKDGVERDFTFDGATKLKDVVRQVSNVMGFGNVLVTADGSSVEPEEGETAISHYSRIEIVPKFAGAIDDEQAEASESDESDEDLQEYEY